jgi:hypothetical protein
MEEKIVNIIQILDCEGFHVHKNIESNSSIFNTITQDIMFCKRSSGIFHLLIKLSIDDCSCSKILSIVENVGITYQKLACDSTNIYNLKLQQTNVSMENFESTKNIVELLKSKYGNNSCGYIKNSPAEIADCEISVAKDVIDIQGKNYPCFHLVMGHHNNNLDVRNYCENLLEKYAFSVGPYMHFVPNELKNIYLGYNGGKDFWYEVSRTI